MLRKSDIPAAESPETAPQTTPEQQPMRTGIWRVVKPENKEKTSGSQTRQTQKSGSTDF